MCVNNTFDNVRCTILETLVKIFEKGCFLGYQNVTQILVEVHLHVRADFHLKARMLELLKFG